MVSKDTHRRGKALALQRPRALGKQADPAPKHVQVNPSEAPAEMLVATPRAEASSSIAVNLAAGNSLPNGDEADSRMSQIKEILGHAAMPVLDKCELVAEWVRYAEAKLSVFGQIVPKPKGGRPEGGVARAARELPVRGKSPDARRKFIERAIKIHGIWPEAKSAARTAGLDDTQSALLAIASEHSPESQLAKVEELADREKAPRRKSGAREDGESALSLAEVEHLKTELVAAIERQRELEEELETARGMASLAPAVDASTNASQDLEIPPALDRRPLGSEDQLKFDVAMTAWESSTELRAALVSASPVVLERFIAAFREDIASAGSPAVGHHRGSERESPGS